MYQKTEQKNVLLHAKKTGFKSVKKNDIMMVSGFMLRGTKSSWLIEVLCSSEQSGRV